MFLYIETLQVIIKSLDSHHSDVTYSYAPRLYRMTMVEDTSSLTMNLEIIDAQRAAIDQ